MCYVKKNKTNIYSEATFKSSSEDSCNDISNDAGRVEKNYANLQ